MRSDKNFGYEISAAGIKQRGDLSSAHIHALRQAAVDIRRGHNALIAAAGATNRPLTATENSTADQMAAALVDVEQHIALAERERDIERTQSTLTAAPDAMIVKPARGRKFAEMFPHTGLDLGGFKSSNDFLATLHAGLADPRLIPDYTPRGGLLATATGAVPSDGGFSVPTQIFAQWLDASLENEIVRSRADVRPMTTAEGKAPGWDDADHTSKLYGGFAGEWLPEDGSMTVQIPVMRMIRLKARKLALLASASNELIADGVSYEEQLGQAITKALGWFLDLAFLSGTGAAQPFGVFNAPCTITVAKENNQTAATILYENLTKMFARLHPASYANSVWVCNSTAIPKLLQLSIAIGVGGAYVPVLTESNGQFRILTRPVVFTEKVPTLGTKGDIGLYDFSQYIVGMRAEFQLAKSQHVGFANDSTYYRGLIRVDGQPKLQKPITPLNGDTLSPFVVLADRS